VAKSKPGDKDQYDVAIVGAGPAGSTAAIILASQGHRVIVLDREKFPRPVPCAGWVSAKAKSALGELHAEAADLLDRPFTDVSFYNLDFTKKAKPRFKDVVGYIIDRGQFDNLMIKTAVRQGATFQQQAQVKDLRLRESSVDLSLADGANVTSRLLILASGRNTELLDRIGFARRVGESPIWSAQVEGAIPVELSPDPTVIVVLGLDGGNSFGLCTSMGKHLVINVNWRGEPDHVLPQLARLCRTAYEKKIVPVDLSPKAESARVLRSPAAAALDMDTHVAKHTLLVGDAGGFISSASNEGIYPAIWSAKLAAKAVNSALKSTYSQDELMAFDSLWRMEMADHLRSPHTDIRFLLPLIFSNQPMADRMGAAFFSGENI
jgi:halogenation protein CepH